jgi:hypothetical protein
MLREDDRYGTFSIFFRYGKQENVDCFRPAFSIRGRLKIKLTAIDGMSLPGGITKTQFCSPTLRCSDIISPLTGSASCLRLWMRMGTLPSGWPF